MVTRWEKRDRKRNQRRSMKEQMDELSEVDRYKQPKIIPQAPYR